MNRIVTQGTVKQITPSQVKKGVSYVIADTDRYGEVKFVTTHAVHLDSKVLLQSQRARAMTDRIRWEHIPFIVTYYIGEMPTKKRFYNFDDATACVYAHLGTISYK